MGNLKKRLSMTLGRRKDRDETYADKKTDSVADRSGKKLMFELLLLLVPCK